jgi:hypothetical protein
MGETLGRSKLVPIGFAVSIAAAVLTGIAAAQPGSLDNPPPSAVDTTKQAAVAEPPATALSGSSAIDPIGPAMDLAAFLKPGVPAELTRAALRRAWSSDPAIRDFVGLSEDLVEPGR